MYFPNTVLVFFFFHICVYLCIVLHSLNTFACFSLFFLYCYMFAHFCIPLYHVTFTCHPIQVNFKPEGDIFSNCIGRVLLNIYFFCIGEILNCRMCADRTVAPKQLYLKFYFLLSGVLCRTIFDHF